MANLGPIGKRLREIQWNSGLQIDNRLTRLGRQVERAIVSNAVMKDGRLILTPAGAAMAKMQIRAAFQLLRPGFSLIVERAILETERMAERTEGTES